MVAEDAGGFSCQIFGSIDKGLCQRAVWRGDLVQSALREVLVQMGCGGGFDRACKQNAALVGFVCRGDQCDRAFAAERAAVNFAFAGEDQVCGGDFRVEIEPCGDELEARDEFRITGNFEAEADAAGGTATG